MDCNQSRLPILFLQDVNGFMVGRDSEQAGIIRAGAKLVNVIANSVVPKLTVILGGSFGAGNYALCGKAFDPRFIFAWPTARYAVMGGEQAASTLLDITISALRRAGPRAGRGGAGGAAPQGGGQLRGADRRPLRGGPVVGGQHPRSGGDAGGAADGPGGGDAVRRRPAVPDGRVASLKYSAGGDPPMKTSRPTEPEGHRGRPDLALPGRRSPIPRLVLLATCADQTLPARGHCRKCAGGRQATGQSGG